MEGILRGLGKQNFSSLNYLAEYTVRISVLLICVPLFGFYGIVASYMACNLTGNTVRLIMVLRATKLKPDWRQVLVVPAASLMLSWQISTLVRFGARVLHMSQITEMFVFTATAAGVFLFVRGVLGRVFREDVRRKQKIAQSVT